MLLLTIVLKELEGWGLVVAADYSVDGIGGMGIGCYC